MAMFAIGGAGVARGGVDTPGLGVGVDANSALEMERAGRQWRVDGAPVEPFAAFARAGCEFARVRAWTSDAAPSGLLEATEVAPRAQRAALRPHLVYFLSAAWADLDKQPSPRQWAGLDDAARAGAIEVDAERTTRRLVDSGVRVSVIEVGNEIDFGIAGVFEEDWAKRVSEPFMATHVWPRVATMLAAAQRGAQ